MYETLILIDRDTIIESSQFVEAVRAKFASVKNSPTIKNSSSSVELKWGDFSLEIYHAKEDHVLEESQDIAKTFASEHVKTDSIAACKERIEIAGTDDPGMDYFNDFCDLLATIEALGTVYTFDQGSGSFMNL